MDYKLSMKNNPNLPPDWAMPDDQADQINDMMNKKPTSPVDAIEDALKELAGDIALKEPIPLDWEGWVSYILEKMEMDAERRVKHLDYEEMLKSLFENIESRIKDVK